MVLLSFSKSSRFSSNVARTEDSSRAGWNASRILNLGISVSLSGLGSSLVFIQTSLYTLSRLEIESTMDSLSKKGFIFGSKIGENRGGGIGGIQVGVLDDGSGGIGRPEDASGEREEMLESERERVFEFWDDGLEEESGINLGERVEEDAFDWVESEPEDVEGSEREGG
ncbi:hypothetical protein G2W53_027864 [Senna tora]|uniref:Uncharacterized protein n=1 Tax=Senna tora TaxID=362788 RepID=A0A834WMM1_9FABA|nr:hypothetical protein G2W53_027864 [Senna tora]